MTERPARQSSERSFRPDIEGLRAIAVLMVLLNHAGLAALSGGYIGVDVFFVLSGFLITGLLLKEVDTTGGLSLTQFYARRARRLLPAGALVLTVTVLASYAALGTSRADRVSVDAIWSSLFASNFRFIEQRTDYMDASLPPSPLQHFWSLAVEEQFYMVWPALILLMSLVLPRVSLRAKLAVSLTVIIGASLLWSVRETTSNGTAAYFSPFTRACELGAGALLAIAAPRLVGIPRLFGIVMSWAGVATILAGGVALSGASVFPGYLVLIPVVGAVLTIAGGSAAPGAGAERVLGLSPFQWVGKLSYSLYLWHWPVLVLAAGWAGRDLTLPESLLLCVVALGLSVLTYRLLEDPVRNASSLRQRAPAYSLAVGALLVALPLATALLSLNADHREGSGRVAAAQLGAEYPDGRDVLQAVEDGELVTTWPAQPERIANPAYSKECNVTRNDTTSSVCIHGDPAASRTVVIFGDSRAAMWIPAFDLIGKEGGWRVAQLTKPGCQAADFPRYSSTLKREYTECAAYREFALAKIAELRPEVVIISSAGKDAVRWVDGEGTQEGVIETWASGLGSVIDRIAPHTGRVVVLGDMAYPAEPGIDCLTAHPNDVAACNTPRDEAVMVEHNAMEQRVADEHGAVYVDAIRWFCTDTTCPALVGGLTTHRDSYHAAENYLVWLSRVAGEQTGLLPEGEPLFRA